MIYRWYIDDIYYLSIYLSIYLIIWSWITFTVHTNIYLGGILSAKLSLQTKEISIQLSEKKVQLLRSGEVQSVQSGEVEEKSMIVDLGCGTGTSTRRLGTLKKDYRI